MGNAASTLGVTVVIATRDRPVDLRRAVAALARQRTSRSWELVVVDDGSEPAVTSNDVAGPPGVRIVRAAGQGPAAARNSGVREARGAVVAFTDDDTVPSPDWLDAGLAYLDRHPEAVGVQGPILSLPYDPLREISLDVQAPGAYYTANIAYRRATLDSVGAFRPELFPMHCEDIDLAFRALRLGPIGFEPRMVVEHIPRPISLWARARRGRMVRTELALQREHRARYGFGGRLPGPVFVLANALRFLSGEATRDGADLLRRPTRGLRFAGYAVLHLAFVVAALARRPAR